MFHIDSGGKKKFAESVRIGVYFSPNSDRMSLKPKEKYKNVGFEVASGEYSNKAHNAILRKNLFLTDLNGLTPRSHFVLYALEKSHVDCINL